MSAQEFAALGIKPSPWAASMFSQATAGPFDYTPRVHEQRSSQKKRRDRGEVDTKLSWINDDMILRHIAENPGLSAYVYDQTIYPSGSGGQSKVRRVIKRLVSDGRLVAVPLGRSPVFYLPKRVPKDEVLQAMQSKVKLTHQTLDRAYRAKDALLVSGELTSAELGRAMYGEKAQKAATGYCLQKLRDAGVIKGRIVPRDGAGIKMLWSLA